MIEKMMKAVKRNNKRRSVNITIGAVVGFLLSCTAIMGQGVIIGEIDGNFGITSGGEISGTEFNETTKTYTNNGEITGDTGISVSGAPTTNKNLNIVNNGSINVDGNGIYLRGGSSMVGEITNNGSIESEQDGIVSLGILEGNIINNGTIKVMTKTYNGIHLNSIGKLKGNIINKGEILNGGYGISTETTVTGNIENEGNISSESIKSFDNAFIGTSNIRINKNVNVNGIVEGSIKNTGVMESENIGKGNEAGVKDSNSIWVTGTVKKDIENIGTITSKSAAGIASSIKIDIYGGIPGKVTGSIKNSGVMKSESNGTEKSYGINIGGTLTAADGTSIENNGTIGAKTDGINIATGATVTGKILNNGTLSSTIVNGTLTATDGIAIENNGTIDSKKNGINITSKETITGNIINNGTLKSVGVSNSILLSEGTLKENIINKGKISTKHGGIASFVDGTMTGNIENDGFINIETKADPKSNGVSGIWITEALNGQAINRGRIKSVAAETYNGINGKNVSSGIENSGYLDINSGVGIQAENASQTTNNGNIKVGEGKGIVITKTSTLNNAGLINSIDGVGLSIENNATSTDSYNQGVIYGKTNAISNAGTIGLTNNGLLINADKDSDILSQGIDNKGIAFSVVDNNQYFIENRSTYTGVDTRTVINADLEDDYDSVTKEVSGTKSIKSSELGNKYTNDYKVYIMNGINDTLVINDEAELGTGSGARLSTIINAYGQAMVMNDGTKLTAENTIFNGGVDGTSATVVLKGNNTLTLTGRGDTSPSIINGNTKIEGTKNKFSMNASIQNGDIIDEGTGTELSIANKSYVNGNITAGTGSTLNINDSYMNGNVAAKGNVTIGKSNVNGTLSGNDLTVNESYLNEAVTATGNVTIEKSNVNGTLSGKDLTVNESYLNEAVTAAGNVTIEESYLNGDIAVTGNVTIADSNVNKNIAINGTGKSLSISGENTYINGDMKSTGTGNALNLNGKSNGNSLNMFHNVAGFNEMNIADGSVTFFESSKVTGTEKLNVTDTGILNLRLKKSGNKDNESGLDKATHSFSENEKMVMEGLDSGGTLNFITNGIGQGAYIDVNNMQIKNMKLETSSVLDYYKFDGNGGLVLKAADSLGDMKAAGTLIMDSTDLSGNNPGGNPEDKPEDNPGGNPEDDGSGDILGDGSNIFDENFDSINSIYGGIRHSTGENLNALRDLILLDRNTEEYNGETSKEEQLRNLRAYLNEVYTQSPYALSSELSRKSAGMFREIVADNMFRPNLNQWMIMGGLTHIDGGTKDTYYGEVYEMDGKNSLGTKVDTKLTGAYALGKYGYSENVTLGVTVGGNRSEAELAKSKVKGNSGYVGAFAENYRGNLTLKAGAGVQYSEYDADRSTIGGYSYSDKYSDMAYDIYLNGRYSNALGNNLFLEPYATLSYTYVDQEGIDEGNKVLAMKTDSKSFDYTAAKVGVDLKKVIPHEIGKSTLSAGVSYTKLLNGADADNLTANYGAKDFDILVASKNEHSLGVNAKYALELQSGILFDVKGNYSFERDSHNNNAKNKNKGEWIVGAGLGYKF